MSFGDQVVAGQLGTCAFEPKTCDGNMHDVGPQRHEALIVDAQLALCLGDEIEQHHIGTLDQLDEQRMTFRRREIGIGEFLGVVQSAVNHQLGSADFEDLVHKCLMSAVSR